MGQEIFYCAACKSLLRSRDLEKGAAVRVDDHIFCRTCAPETAPPPATPRAGKHSDSAHMRVTGRTPRVAMPPSGERKAPIATILAAVGGVALILLLGILAAGGAKPVPRREEPEPEPAPTATTVVVEPPRPEPRVVEPRPKPASREASAKKMLEDARGFLAATPDNLDGALERARMALLEAAGTPVELDARRLEEEVRARLKERKAAADARVKEAVEKERYGEAIALLEKTPGGAGRLAETRLALEKAWGEVKDKLFAARKKGAAADVKALAARAEAWDVAPVREELAKILASPVDVDPPPEVLAWRKKLAELLLPLDYAAAFKELEKWPGADKADLEALRLAGEIQRECAFVAARLKPGQDLRLDRYEGEITGKLLRASVHEFELVTGEGRVSVPAVEITPAGWCDLLKAAPRAAQLYRALEGDVRDGAPPNIAALGDRLVRQLATPAELAARQLYADAERDFALPATRLASAPRYAALAKDASAFARRVKGLVEERAHASQEVFLTVDDLIAGGQFVPSEALKGVPTLTTAADGRDSYAEFELEMGESTRAWVYASACCLEMFAIGVQAPDLTGPNPKDPKEQIAFPPGGPAALPLKVSTASLRVKHGHPGRELKWFWIPVPLPKGAGVRAVRLVAEREGLSIAYVWLSVGRPGPPRESELKEFEKGRAAVEALRGPVVIQTGSLLREVWRNIDTDKVAALVSSPAFPDKPSESNLITLFEGPTNIAENYGTRVRGYVHPPATGEYVFFMATDDDSELWLSADESPARRRKIATITGATKPRDWDDKDAAKSEAVVLKAGKRYYVELLHKEGTREDNFAVGWKLPDGTMERPIPGHRLSPWTAGAKTGRASSFYRAINFAGPALVVDGQSWEGKDAPNVAFEATPFENAAVPLVPPVSDAAKTQMIRSSIWRREGLNVTVSSVPPGRYHVYAWIWEDNSNEIFDILLNNRVVSEKHNSGAAGRWERLGPWPVEVADGRIELRTTGPADANLSGLEIWKAR